MAILSGLKPESPPGSDHTILKNVILTGLVAVKGVMMGIR
jgi:hypothetical protein